MLPHPQPRPRALALPRGEQPLLQTPSLSSSLRWFQTAGSDAAGDSDAKRSNRSGKGYQPPSVGAGLPQTLLISTRSQCDLTSPSLPPQEMFQPLQRDVPEISSVWKEVRPTCSGESPPETVCQQMQQSTPVSDGVYPPSEARQSPELAP